MIAMMLLVLSLWFPAVGEWAHFTFNEAEPPTEFDVDTTSNWSDLYEGGELVGQQASGIAEEIHGSGSTFHAVVIRCYDEQYPPYYEVDFDFENWQIEWATSPTVVGWRHSSTITFGSVSQ